MIPITYIKELLKVAVYHQDEHGIRIGEIPWHDNYLSQWNTIEEARDDMIDVIESIMMYRLRSGDDNAWQLIVHKKAKSRYDWVRILASSMREYA